MAASLSEQLSPRDKREAVIEDALHILDAEVKDKSGISGMAVKGAFKIVKGVQPGFIRKVVNNLFDDFIEKIDPVYQRAISESLPPGAYIEKERSQVASALLSVTDRKAEAASSELIRKTYSKLRPSAQKHVEAAAPRLAELLNKHAASA